MAKNEMPETVKSILNLPEVKEIFMELVNEHSKKLTSDNYLEKPTESDEKVKEQMLYGEGDSLVEKDKKKNEYQENQLNE